LVEGASKAPASSPNSEPRSACSDSAVDLDRVVARARAEDDAAAGPLRGADRALAGAAGALLAPRLRAAAADHAARAGGVRAPAARGELGDHGLVHERAVERRAEHGVVELQLLRAAARRSR
jgi:hypothetical protein